MVNDLQILYCSILFFMRVIHVFVRYFPLDSILIQLLSLEIVQAYWCVHLCYAQNFS